MATERIKIEVGPADDPEKERWSHTLEALEVLDGLALHRAHSELGFVVTHIQSGRSVMRGIPDKTGGHVALQAIAARADWTKPADELEVRKLKAALRKIARQVGAPAPKFREDPQPTEKG